MRLADTIRKATDEASFGTRCVPIQIPFGRVTLGHIMNAIGEPIDERGPIEGVTRMPIHCESSAFVEQSTTTEVLETGIKPVDLMLTVARSAFAFLSPLFLHFYEHNFH
jgi:F-type H+-transporting ATPase subunit beta